MQGNTSAGGSGGREWELVNGTINSIGAGGAVCEMGASPGYYTVDILPGNQQIAAYKNTLMLVTFYSGSYSTSPSGAVCVKAVQPSTSPGAPGDYSVYGYALYYITDDNFAI